ncbi:hypothetical protein A3742_13350 [Oleiphilus sp. HI0071]|nr:hypothetical protein A3737_14915 [Oleiphilus sp. HI0065]KZY80056.1 hypothetical protein A3742_13350 [Oleiphilus sp. HI0071]KZY96680.1 hypothetical protein A3744_13750 [Oleiphilus sp. HI0073]KZZ10670.1 hypothetical protein A3750_00690 [Oleiphilus sp. HI0079]KZZ15957.1 hypothetical protein A3751_02715 [Oleiphilus sp. HI0080]KZZ40895.1 hypothetical protein A3758_09310 [Oleiphilus sp. HI0118]KZZ50810.1 hypothetical protein A3760_13270 [Oleiphilus sp. HI0122]KZZ73706.1 hypothetical protein A37
MNGLALSVHSCFKQRLIAPVRLLLALYILLTAFAGSSLAFAQGYADQNNLDWHYTIRPSDNLPLVSKRLLKPQYSWTSIAHYNHIKDIDKLQVGSIIKIPVSWLKYQPQPAKIESYIGMALIKRSQDSRYMPISKQSHVYVGDELLTREGQITVEFADGTNLRMDAFSHLVFNKLSSYKEVGMVDTRMRLGRGGIRTQVEPLTKGSRYEISTPSAVAAVRGTDFRLRTNLQGTTLEVLEGAVELMHDHGQELIKAGFGARLFSPSALIETIRLDTLPRIASQSGGSFSDSEQDLDWKGLPAGYSLAEAKTTLSANKTASNSAQELESESSSNSASSNNQSAQVSDPNSADVAILDLPLPGSIIDGFTAEFTWSVNSPSTLSRLELSQNSDYDRLALPTKWSENTAYRIEQQLPAGNYFWRVRTLSTGNAESLSASRAVSIQGKLDPVSILTVNYIGDQVGMFWHKVDNAKGYVLQVSDDKEFRRLLKEETLGKTSAFLKLPEGKTFYARVKGLGDEVYASEFGPQKEIKVEPKPN